MCLRRCVWAWLTVQLPLLTALIRTLVLGAEVFSQCMLARSLSSPCLHPRPPRRLRGPRSTRFLSCVTYSQAHIFMTLPASAKHARDTARKHTDSHKGLTNKHLLAPNVNKQLKHWEHQQVEFIKSSLPYQLLRWSNSSARQLLPFPTCPSPPHPSPSHTWLPIPLSHGLIAALDKGAPAHGHGPRAQGVVCVFSISQ